jgi:hypothetical protein
MTFNVIDYTIWRIHIQISISIHLSSISYDAADGMNVGIYVDSANQTQFAGGPLANQYDQHFLMWDKIYLSELVMNGGLTGATTNTNLYMLYRRYDIRARRKVVNESDTLYLQLSTAGVAVADTYDLFYSVLLRHR